jgi:acyl-CoA dehydrogenase
MTDTNGDEKQRLAALRTDMRAWLEANAPDGIRNMQPGGATTCWGGRKWVFASGDQKTWLERMAAKGWTVPTWPVAYGGAGLTAQEARILDQEMARIGAKKPLENIGIWMLGPALLKYGTEEQKQTHLPAIARGEIRWCQGYSEPGAGSDLASIKTKGVEAGDDFIVTGSKIWTTHANKSDWIFALVRTEPDASKHEGISFILIDMESEGVSTRPIKLISGDDHFCQTFLDGVRVPQSHVVGERGKGWSITKYLLQHERSMIGEAMGGRSDKRTLAERAREPGNAPRVTARPGLRNEIVQVELDAWAMEIWMERVQDQGRAGQFNPNLPSALKVFGTELSKRRAEAALSIEGPQALAEGSDTAYNWLQWPAGTIGGGTTEIQLNILARRALELPDA